MIYVNFPDIQGMGEHDIKTDIKYEICVKSNLLT
jgi:hypothetical protein